MKTSNMTPYEIRLHLLELAFQVLSAKHSAEGNDARALSAVTTEEVVAEAEKMNKFISSGS